MSNKESKESRRVDEGAKKKSGSVVRDRNKSGSRSLSSSTLEPTERRKLMEERLNFTENPRITKTPSVTTSAAAAATTLRRNLDGKSRSTTGNATRETRETREIREWRRREKKRSETMEKNEKKEEIQKKNSDRKVRTQGNSSVDKRGISTIYKSAYIAKINSGRDKTRTSGAGSGGETSKITSVPSLTTGSPFGKVSSQSEKSAPTKSKIHRRESNDEIKSKKESKRVSSRERRRSRTLSPSEVKILRSNAEKIVNSTRKIDRTEIGEEKGKISKEKSNNVKSNVEKNEGRRSDDDEKKEFEYEDDFQDYESDFEECTDDSRVTSDEENTSSDEIVEIVEPIPIPAKKQNTSVKTLENRKSDDERMLDSGHYEIAEAARKRFVTLESISSSSRRKNDDISNVETIVRSVIVPCREKVQQQEEEGTNDNKSLPSSMDEGFEEDARSGDFVKSPTISRISFAAFRDSAEKKDEKNGKKQMESESGKKISRGRKLLEMIKLDRVEWSIHECKPIVYEEFIRMHGKFDTRQVSIQTNDGNNLQVEAQTDAIESSDKWTQCPVRCRSTLETEDDVTMFNAERLGVGSDPKMIESSTSAKFRPVYDVLELNEFVKRAGRVVTTILEDERTSGGGEPDTRNTVKPKETFSFTENAVKLSIDNVTFLLTRSVTIIRYSNVSNKILLTIHAPAEEEIETTNNEDFVTDCSIGCLWNIRQPSKPIKLFYSPNAITACCFHSSSNNIVIGGLEDGSLSLWDLNEDDNWHRKIVDADNCNEWIVRSPTFSSVGNFDDSSHDSEIVSIAVLSKIDDSNEFDTPSFSNKFMPIQICSLDSNGKMIVWSVLRNLSRANVEDLGLSWWGDLRLVKSQEILINSRKIGQRIDDCFNGFTDLKVDSNDTNSLYVATSGSDVLRATRFGKRAAASVYKSKEIDSAAGNAECIEICPFNEPYFLVGCSDGSIRLHATNAEKSLLRLKNEDSKASIKCIEWSKSKPLTFYALDVDSKIHVWDLGNSDVFPIETITTENERSIDVIRLSSWRIVNEIMQDQYMALGLTNGSVEVHKLKSGYRCSTKEALKRETNTFLRYVAIL